MFGRPVHLLAAAAVAAAASLFSISDASAGCYGCGGGYYQAPVAYYTAPVVYSYSYAAPAAYSSGCGCGGGGGLFSSGGYGGYGGYGYAARPMYAVNQGPAYTDPVVNAEPTPAYDEGYGDGGYRGGYGYRGYGLRGYGYRGYGARFGVRGYGLRGYGIRGGYGRFGMQRHRYGAGVPGRIGMRAMGGMNRWGGGAIAPRHWSGSVSPHRGGMMRRH